ncbi:hypothetical protein [Spiroplasma endosymbiont of Diplazon laetatorius]|uniref:hypothetical protein n=1 Tax=Spiroplasma endosymbiont of Diplazon laetatorius TaxID=3066322 RepID=UPI0030CF9236
MIITKRFLDVMLGITTQSPPTKNTIIKIIFANKDKYLFLNKFDTTKKDNSIKKEPNNIIKK